MCQSTWRSQVDFQNQWNSYKIAQNIQNKYKKQEKNSKTKTWQKAKKVISHPTDNLLWGMKCFDPAYWSIWPTIFSFQWMQELLLRCPVRISMIGYVSVALTTAIWKPRYIYLFVFFPFFFWDIPRTSLVRSISGTPFETSSSPYHFSGSLQGSFACTFCSTVHFSLPLLEPFCF